jgi:hypothetical protein
MTTGPEGVMHVVNSIMGKWLCTLPSPGAPRAVAAAPAAAAAAEAALGVIGTSMPEA